MQIELWFKSDPQNFLGEGPLWHQQEKKLYWVDILRGQIQTYDPVTAKHEIIYEDRAVGGYTIEPDGSLILFRDKGNIVQFKNGKVFKTILEQIEGEVDGRFNDVIAAPCGRVFCGTISTEKHAGSLYRLDMDGSLHKAVDDIGISNGMGFTPDNKHMYHTDSTARKIYRYDYDQTTGEISNKIDFAEIEESLGVPDGMTVDSQGHVWSAIWGGSCVIEFDAQGKELKRYPTTCVRPSCVSFIGPDYKRMVITSYGGQEESGLGENAGGLFTML
ncbi:MAG: SMP-30/gluconolactonase/LRE family protein, partial [Phycisphaeraceae bacterium]|nr:SMP-30/gluconolactonase/LRE family protein [Phycisphaeraceae bacterium]